MKEIAFIINPISGTHNKDSIINAINSNLNREIYHPRLVYTEYAGHATELAESLVKEGIKYIVAIGGDGTVNEIARALVHTDAVLGIIPSGSGNGLARHLEIPMDVPSAIKILNESIEERIDYGKINNLPFFCTCGVGFDAFVSLKFANSGKRGLLTYLEKTLMESLNYKPQTYEIETEDGTQKYKAFLIACGNAAQYGNNAFIAPNATITDGLLDVTILEPFTMLDVPQLSFQLFNKTIDQNSRIKSFKCHKLCIRREESGVAHYDGDPFITEKDVNIEIVPHGLSVIVPKVNQLIDKKTSILNKTANGIRPISESLVEDISNANRRILMLNKQLIKKLKKK